METVRVIWRVFLLVFCQTVISTGVSLTSYLLGYIVDLTETGNDIYGGIVFYSVTVIIVAATIMVRERVRCNAVNGLRHRLRRVLIDGIFCGDLQEHGKQKHGEYYAVIDGQVGEFSYDAVQIVLKTAEIIVSVFVTMYLLFSCSRLLTVCVIVLFPILALCTIKAMGTATKTHAIRQEAERNFFGVMSEIRSLMKELHILPMAGLFQKRYRDVSKGKYNADLRHKQAVFFCRGVEKVATAFGTLVVIGIGFHEYYTGRMSIGQILASVGYAEILLSELTQINYIYDMKVSNRELSHHMKKVIGTNKSTDIGKRFSGEVEEIKIRDVSFAYDDGENVLNKVSASFYPGTITVVVGSSGAGKSTLLNLLTKRIPLSKGSGQILYNGINIDGIDGKSLRGHISYMGQISFFFDGTVYENLAWAIPGIDEENARLVLNRAGLNYLDLNKPMGEGGIKLSGGERQRLAFARCIAKNAEVFILDEPFAQIDEENEKIIRNYILNEKTKIFIMSTHKTDICQYADQVIYL